MLRGLRERNLPLRPYENRFSREERQAREEGHSCLSLVWFLKDYSEARQAIGALVREKADHYCLEPDQRAWLTRGSGRAHRY